MTQYTVISDDEFESFLDDVATYEKVHVPGVTENVYDLPLPSDDLVIRIYSTLQDGHTRSKGSDAIRAVIWDRVLDAPAGGEKKTLRIGTWRTNLRPKIESLYANWRQYDHGHCDCGGRMVERSGKYGDFLGCSNYPRCRNTRQL